MDDEFSRNGSCCNTATPLLRNGIGGQQSSRLANQSPTTTANMTSSLECNHDSQHPEALTCIIAGTSPEHGAVDDDEEENAKFTKNVIISYLQAITFQNPKIFQLLHQVNILERDSEEIKKQAVTPRTTSMHREYRDTMLSNIRAELRVALTTRDETDEQ